ncbi:MAG: response regulator [Desulfobacterales bacterium]|nr:response regulator [Desulfobacterales bacterium]
MPDPIPGEYLIIENVKIIVVDDDILLRKLTVTALSYCVNRKVVSFSGGRQAWEFIKTTGDVDIVISEAEMPDMSGFDLMAKVRERYPETIFIIISGVAGHEDRSRKEGATAFLAKPFEINDLFNIVQYFVVDHS